MRSVTVFIRGLLTGLILQLAIGPVFIFIINIAMQNGLKSGIAAVSAVTLADYIYITLAILGTGKIIEAQNRERFLIFLSSFVLIVFGVLMIRRGMNSVFTESSASGIVYSSAGSFASAFILTISSPLTIVFWSGVFAAKAAEYSFSGRELSLFGFSAGLATFVFLGSGVVILSFVKVMIPVIVIQGLNVLVGVVLAGYGLIRLREIWLG